MMIYNIDRKIMCHEITSDEELAHTVEQLLGRHELHKLKIKI